MSVLVSYRGNVGNCLFRYVYARLIAERNDFSLLTPFPYQQFIETTPHKEGKKFTGPIIHLNEPSHINADAETAAKIFDFHKKLKKNLLPGQYILNGCFEHAELFNPYEDQIRSFFKMDQAQVNTKDIILNIRLGDFVDLGKLIAAEWYMDILKNETFERLYITGASLSEPYLRQFMKYDPIVVKNDPIDNFHLIRSFDRIICSNSTFCWWAAFFSKATKIYTSDKWLSPILKSCKNSISIPGECVPSYKTFFYYPSVHKYLPSQLKLNYVLENYIVFDKRVVLELVSAFLRLVYNNLRLTSTKTSFAIQTEITGVCKHVMHFYNGGSWFVEGTALLPDFKISFADWKSFHDWVLGKPKESWQPYVTIKGSLNCYRYDVNLLAYKVNFETIYNKLVKKTLFLKYHKTNVPLTQTLMTVCCGKTTLIFVEQKDNFGGLYLSFEENTTEHQVWKDSIHSDNVKGIFLEISLPGFEIQQLEIKPYENYNQCLSGSLFNVIMDESIIKGMKMAFFQLSFKELADRQFSYEEAIRLFGILKVNFLLFDNFVISKLPVTQ